jgi:signal transduction histidine kinase
MGMVLKNKPSFHVRLFLTLILLLGLFLIAFLIFQFSREKTYKVERLNAQLQVLNSQLSHHLSDTIVIDSLLQQQRPDLPEDLRVTVMDTAGWVLYDTEKKILLDSFTNHSDRPEVVLTMVNGSGYTIRRLSETTRKEYFYSARRAGGFIVRSAIPYSFTLKEILKVDRLFLPVMISFAVIISILSLILTRPLGRNINRLKKFAQLADKGEPVQDIGSFPKDELGEISNHIIQLYSRLQQTKKALETEHKVVLQQKQEQTLLKKQLTQNINHELKTPVSIIQGYLETLMDNPDIPQDKQRVFIENCYKQSNRLSRLLNDISTITRMDEARQIINKTEVHLNDIIQDVFLEMAKHLQEKNIKIVADIPPDTVLKGSPEMMHSIFRNLTDNAINYSGCDTIFVSVTGPARNFYTILFADNGIGIKEDHMSRIFERFYRIDTGRSRLLGGTGLGLSIVKNAILLHGGSIRASKRHGGGVEFIFTLKKE